MKNILFVESSERTIEIGWENKGKEKTICFLCAELVDLMHKEIEMGHELIGCYYDTLGNYYAKIEVNGMFKTVHLASYARRVVFRKWRKLQPIINEIYNEMVIEDFVLA